MTGFVRVYDKNTKTVYSRPADADHEGLEVLDAPSHDVYGNPFEPEYNVENKTAANKVAKAETQEVSK